MVHPETMLKEAGQQGFSMVPRDDPSGQAVVSLVGAFVSIFSREAIVKHFCFVRSASQPAESPWGTLLHLRVRLRLPHCNDGKCILDSHVGAACALIDLASLDSFCGFNFKAKLEDISQIRIEADQLSAGERHWVCIGFSPSVKEAVLKAAQYTVALTAAFISVGCILSTPFCPGWLGRLSTKPTRPPQCTCRTGQSRRGTCSKP